MQAVGACAGMVLARAIVRDLYIYKGDRAAQMMSTLMTVMAIAPLLGPILGGQILALAGWRAIFWTLVGVGFIVANSIWGALADFPERAGAVSALVGAIQYGSGIGVWRRRAPAYGATFLTVSTPRPSISHASFPQRVLSATNHPSGTASSLAD